MNWLDYAINTVFFICPCVASVIALEDAENDDHNEAGKEDHKHKAVHDREPMNFEVGCWKVLVFFFFSLSYKRTSCRKELVLTNESTTIFKLGLSVMPRRRETKFDFLLVLSEIVQLWEICRDVHKDDVVAVPEEGKVQVLK